VFRSRAAAVAAAKPASKAHQLRVQDDDNRARALRRLNDTIAALDLARRSESGLSGEEVDAQHDNLVRAVRLLRSGAR
jgi:hypothetical protein